ncbi:Acetyl-CoA carboxylase biotin carboxylase subunit [Candidatus Bealeia paramacronuclearis]|uniref:propionyl-CoA carboxylase n=1 Tax=Candidatus Bealeia paramacronuclearis TaxID=1921001 RepID=A0ABZ2C5U0_9PROT|nr:Acetyl-CoA carboxylase biotin carboxylase subunit [Candidatus Bealeia paramacronuclearis]
MFSKILIANRGEIACRVIRTAQKMGISCVAVYSDVDQDAVHVEMAEEAIALGGKTPRESYLDISKIMKAIKDSGAEAVHPGYGFLSENPEFASSLQKAGIALIGPSLKAIEAMGDKLRARKIAEEAQVNIIPGTPDSITQLNDAKGWAEKIGYPLMVKASAGGGGKGMRIVRDLHTLEESIKSAQNEARSSFGDERVFIEKYIENPRHIEIQVLGDKHGNIIHLGERECSLQRRHQKVIEEAPSSFITPEIREAMGAQAVALAARVGYDSAGTVEFVMGRDRKFYFLEMNTRLQVEHPVTEAITGYDLVEEMIRIAAGEKLRISQKDVTFKGHSFESRIYAEDPTREFLPSSGRLVYYRLPPTDENLRIDTGVKEGDEISNFYDPMIAKVITHGNSREEARFKMMQALDASYIRGISTNTAFLSRLLNQPQVIAGDLSTHLIEELFPQGDTGEVTHDKTLFLSVAAVVHWIVEGEAKSTLSHPEQYVIQFQGTFHPVKLIPQLDYIMITGDEWTVSLKTNWEPSRFLMTAEYNGCSICVQVERNDPSEIKLIWYGQRAILKVFSPEVAELLKRMPPKIKPDFSRLVMSPMPGLVVDLHVHVGQAIKMGQPVAVIEAMKMENIIRAEREGVIEEVFVQKGQSVNVDQQLARIG